MGSIARRLSRLEERLDAPESERKIARRVLGDGDSTAPASLRPESERKIARRVLGRLTDEELDAYEAAVVRHEAGENPTEADRIIAARVEAITKEAKNEPLPAS